MRKVKESAPIDSAKEFLTALDAIVKEKGIDKNQVLEAMELALASAYKKHTGKTNGKAKVNPETGEIKVYSYVTVVEEVENPDIEISLKDAQKINKDLVVGDTIDTEVTTEDFGRVAASTAKQVVIQKVREAERQVTLDAFVDKQDELLIGTVALEDTDNYFIDLGRSNGILPKKDIIPGEKIEMGSTIKVYVTKVDNSGRNLVIKLSRSHYGFVKRLFELEIPEFSDGTLLMYSVAREAGVRSKVAVYTEKANFEPIGACIGEKGSRIANIIKELHGEKVDVIKYDEDYSYVGIPLSIVKIRGRKTGKKKDNAENNAFVEFIMPNSVNRMMKLGNNDNFTLSGKSRRIYKAGSRLEYLVIKKRVYE